MAKKYSKYDVPAAKMEMVAQVSEKLFTELRNSDTFKNNKNILALFKKIRTDLWIAWDEISYLAIEDKK